MAGEQLPSTQVGAQGLPGDRGWAVRDEGVAASAARRRSRADALWCAYLAE
jgi:uncharacterized protein YcbX